MSVTESDQTTPEPKSKIISSADLSRHNTASDLWICVQGKVYDVTSWIADHPGGDLPLLYFAGQDATDSFIAYHPPSAWAHIDRFHVAHLSDYQASAVSKDYRRLVSEFSKLDLFNKKGHGAAITFVLMILAFLTSVSLVLFTDTWQSHLAAGAVMGCIWIQSGWVGHDSGHYNIMTSKSANRLAQIVTGNCITGVSRAWWKRSHNAHHIACNSLEFDPDLQHLPMFAISDKFFASLTTGYYDRKMTFDKISRFLISYQHFTYYPFMCFGRLSLFALSFLLLISDKPVPDRWQEIASLVVFWTWYPLLVSCLPNWPERVMFVLASFIVTGLQHVQFTLNHFSCDVYVGPPKGNDWFEKQTAGSTNIDCPPWMDWFHGGLQFQVEHHLFPRLPRCHLRRIAPTVRELCKKHNLTYNSVGFIEAHRRMLRVLKTAAMQAQDLSSPGPPKNLVWEAVNTHG